MHQQRQHSQLSQQQSHQQHHQTNTNPIHSDSSLSSTNTTTNAGSAAAAAAAAVCYLQNISRTKSPIPPFSPSKQRHKFDNTQAICAINDAYLTTIEKSMLANKKTDVLQMAQLVAANKVIFLKYFL